MYENSDQEAMATKRTFNNRTMSKEDETIDHIKHCVPQENKYPYS